MKRFLKLKWGLLFITSLFTTNLFAQYTEVEPNDDYATANPIVASGTYTGNISGGDIADVFLFYAGVTANVSVSVALPGGYALSYTINSDDNLEFSSPYAIATDNESGGPHTFDLAPGTYFAVYISSFVGTGGYTITVSVNSGYIGPPPGGVSGANLWYRADAGVTASSGYMSKWANQGSLGTTADAELLGTQAGDSHPAYNTAGSELINFNPSVKFDGVNDFIQTGLIPSFLGTTDKNVSQFIVYKKSGASDTHIWNIDNGTVTSNSGTLILLGAKSNGQLLQSGWRIDYPTAASENETALYDMIATTSSTPANDLFSLNKNAKSGQNTPANAYVEDAGDHPLRFGRFGNNFGHAVISELIIYPSSLSATDRQKVQSYLAIKYGLSLGNNIDAALYYNSAGSLVYINAAYNQDVFGIGKDDGSALNQTQSNSMNTGSGDGTGQSGKGNIVLSNASSLGNGDYLLIGHDSYPLNSTQYSNLPASVNQPRLVRQWKVNHTGDVGTVNLTFDLNGVGLEGTIGTATTDFNILIDNDFDNDFTDATAINPSTVNGSLLTFNALTLPHNAVFTFTAQLTKTWDGSEGATWATDENWAQDVSPDASGFDHVVIADVANDPVIPNNGQISVKNLTIDASATLTIASDAVGTGSLIINGTLTNNGAFAAERYITGGWSTWDAGYHQISSPITSQAISDFATGNYDFYGWDEASELWMNYQAAGFQAWNNGTTNMNPGQGYLISYDQASQTKSFVGAPNLADITITNQSLSGGSYSGWHLLGNPFTSALKWNDGNWALSNVAGTAKIWGASSKSYTDIAANGFIPANQGFMVQVNADNNNSVTIPLASRDHDVQNWYKSSNSEQNTIKIIAAEADMRSWQEHKILLNENATQGFDFDFDSRFIGGNAPHFYAIQQGERLSTNSLPQLSAEMQIPMGFVKNDAADYKIELMESIDGITLYLRDTKTGADHLLNDSPYLFTSEENDQAERFVLHFSVVGIDENVTESDAVGIWTSGNVLYLNNKENTTGSVTVYNMYGQLVTSTSLDVASNQKVEIDAPAGYYVVSVQTAKALVNKKVFIQ
ncbi:MAG: T9SS type A sorting domain-containing protein [Bacteroidales bacterium]|nr:T9SS type A sorting domain-containing protein [Bacteroidales bacterium]